MGPKAAVLRDAGGLSLRHHLIAAAARLISRSGTAGLTVRQIAQEAQVATGVLYNHFDDKEELLALALHAHVHAVETALGDPLGPAGSATVEANLTAFLTRGLALHAVILPAFAGLVAQPGVLARFDALAGGRGLREELIGYLRAEQRLGRLAPGANVEAAATMAIGACHELVLPHLFSGGVPGEVPAGFVAEIVATLLHGIT